ncbi:uncharacterized protein [Rhodnius prolixus]|uniref:uncharacterized protein n=1 Tax=Rhodnius prolixus TaxID=13249 RepID=UPI003D188CBB
MENLSSGHWLFKPPENLSLNAFSYRVNSWLTRNFHQIKWKEGEVDYVELDAILHKHLTHYNKIFVKGLQKKQFLNHYCGNVINLEEFDCPQISQLGPLNDDIDIDNRWVVPYSPLLSKTFNAHINVESCSSVKSIKYICKYVNKGSDMAVFRIENNNVHSPPLNQNDEITNYQIGRYISSNEAVWPRIFHDTALDHAINPPKTTLTEFFELCNRADAFGAFAQTLLYSEVPRYFTWAQSKKWIPRKQGIPVDACPGLFKSNSLGRVYTVNPRQTECFYLRLLLVNVTGPLSFQDIRKVDGQQYPTYKDACLALGLLEDDNHWDSMLAEAALNCTGTQIRLLFAIVLTTCFPARAQMLWDNHKDSMTDDILYRHRTRCNDLTISFSEAMYNEALIAIEDLCIAIANLPISHFGMGSPNRSASDLLNTDMNRELQYDTVQMASIVSRNVPLLNDEQKIIYDRIMLAVSAGQGGFFFLDAPGGTGKTFLISLLLAEIRSKNGIALAVASSGIAMQCAT